MTSSGSTGSYYNTHFLQAPTRAEVSPNRGLLSRPLVPYVLVVKSSMAGWARTHTLTHTHTHTHTLSTDHSPLSSAASLTHRASAACSLAPSQPPPSAQCQHQQPDEDMMTASLLMTEVC